MGSLLSLSMERMLRESSPSDFVSSSDEAEEAGEDGGEDERGGDGALRFRWLGGAGGEGALLFRRVAGGGEADDAADPVSSTSSRIEASVAWSFTRAWAKRLASSLPGGFGLSSPSVPSSRRGWVAGPFPREDWWPLVFGMLGTEKQRTLCYKHR